MRLETSNNGEVTNPSADQINAALAQLPAGVDAFAILARADQYYVQVAGSAQEGFVIEYREGGEDRHFEAVGPAASLGTAQEVFRRYAAGDDGWRSVVAWQPWQSGGVAVSPWLVGGIVVAAIGVVAILVASA